jgi:hypothetical protein
MIDQERFIDFYIASREGLERAEKIIRELPAEIESLKKEKKKFHKKGTVHALNTSSDIGELIKFLSGILGSARKSRSSFELDCRVADQALMNLNHMDIKDAVRKFLGDKIKDMFAAQLTKNPSMEWKAFLCSVLGEGPSIKEIKARQKSIAGQFSKTRVMHHHSS